MTFADLRAYDAYNTRVDQLSFVRSCWQSEVAAFQEFDFAPRWPGSPGALFSGRDASARRARTPGG